MTLVWDESLRQAQELLDFWIRQGATGTDNTVEDSATLTLHVLSSAVFGTKFSSFSEGVHDPPPGYEFSYKDALHLILQSLVVIMIAPQKLLFSPLSPKSLQKLGRATVEFKRYMEELMMKERQLISRGASSSRNLMSALIRASEAAKSNSSANGLNPNQALSDTEIFGNIFFFNVAGHETSANSFSYAIALLAAYPKWQAWLAEEITHVFGLEDIGGWNYHTSFPQLQRCRAVMVSIQWTPKFQFLNQCIV